MKVYDCFMYWDEDLILDLRFNILDKYVDKFVVVESNKTWQNNKKDLTLSENCSILTTHSQPNLTT